MTDELAAVVGPAFVGRVVESVARHPYRYATSATLEELQVSFADGGSATLLLKDLSRDRLLDDARASKPSFLHEPRREVETYRRLLAPAGIGPRCYRATAGSLLLEKVDGVELWQVGELEVWEAVARWLAAFHERFSSRLGEVRAANPYLLEHGPDWYGLWRDRACALLDGADDPRGSALVDALARYDDVIDALVALPVTFVHGELYPSNVLIGGSGSELRVCPVDWEMAAIGSGLIDVAAVTSGWDAASQARLLAAYGAPAGDDVERCRLHLALQWLGWSPRWKAPPEHANDWLGEALLLVEGLGLAR